MKKYAVWWGVLILAVMCAAACGKTGAESEEGSGKAVETEYGSLEENGQDIVPDTEGSRAEGNTADVIRDSAYGSTAAGNTTGKDADRDMSKDTDRDMSKDMGRDKDTDRDTDRDAGRDRDTDRTTDAGRESDAAGKAAASGKLSVEGTRLVDGSGNSVQLKGISTHGLAWYPDYVNQECIRQLKEEWGANVLRLVLYTAEYGGYCSDGSKEELKALVKKGVEYASDCGMYAIIDWHILSDGNPNTYLEEAKDFFWGMSETYAEYTNVLYEICNEPNGGTSWSEVKSYAEQVIEVIRENDQDGIILVGTPNWCQYVEQAAEDPIDDYENIMYTLHFYAATHGEELRNAMVRAIEAGLPVFVSEYGICDASGSGGIDEYQAGQWVNILNEYGISYVAWNLSNKEETSAILKSSCSKVSGFTEEDLSESGKWLYGMLGGEFSGEEAESAEGGEKPGGEAESAGGGEKPGGGEAERAEGGEKSGGGEAESAGEGEKPGGGEAESAEGGEKPVGGETQDFGGGEAGLDMGIQTINSWGQGQDSFYQYSLTITNLTEADLEGWKIRIVFSGDIALSNGWNGSYQAEGNTLTITSMDYNGHIEKEGKAEDIGFIVESREGLEILEISAE